MSPEPEAGGVDREPGGEGAWPFAEGDEIVPGLRAWGLLGEGLRAETWVAWDEDRWCPVAVKLPHPDRVACERTRAALGREVAVTGGLRHPSVQRLLDDRLDGPRPHLVFEYVQGPAVIDLIEDDGRLHPTDLSLLAVQLASVLRYLHRQGIAHLDLKPHNVVERRGHAVLIDFALARPLGHVPPPGRPRGSPPYMAPEQGRLQPASAAMDMFALGALLYHAATGRRPFASDEDALVQLAERAPPVAESAPRLPAVASALIDDLLDPDPAGRPDAAGTLNRLGHPWPAGTPRVWPPFADGRA
ncbi:MAG: serine/threonine protein kinase [Actinobacteria bacterium]|nr:serine/threonine protein kinase [Actinomycetota bacterium]